MAGGFARIVVAGGLIVGCGKQAVANDSDRGARCTATAAVPEHIRTTSCDMMRAIALGMSASPSFHRLVERLAELHGIVYLTPKQVVQSQTRRAIDGTLQHRVTVAGAGDLPAVRRALAEAIAESWSAYSIHFYGSFLTDAMRADPDIHRMLVDVFGT